MFFTLNRFTLQLNMLSCTLSMFFTLNRFTLQLNMLACALSMFFTLNRFTLQLNMLGLFELIRARKQELRDFENFCSRFHTRPKAEPSTGKFANDGAASLDHEKLGRSVAPSDVAAWRSRCSAASQLSARGRVHAKSRNEAYTSWAGASAVLAASAIAR